jgi:hypothetical protein
LIDIPIVKETHSFMEPKDSLRVHKFPPMDPALSELNSVPTFTTYFSNIALMMEAVRTSETSANVYQTTRATFQRTVNFILIYSSHRSTQGSLHLRYCDQNFSFFYANLFSLI